MKGYKCEMKIDELNKLREQFWGKIKFKISSPILIFFQLPRKQTKTFGKF
jgi:hypothetical protein